MAKIKAFNPDEAKRDSEEDFPLAVIESFNEVIKRNYSGRSSTVLVDEVIALISTKMIVSRAMIFENKWLDVEDVYRKNGWDVEYDQPSYGDSDFKPRFVFTKK